MRPSRTSGDSPRTRRLSALQHSPSPRKAASPTSPSRFTDSVPAFAGDAFRVVYALQLGNDVWVVHAFQKKSKQGIKTPKREKDLVEERLKRLKEMLQ